MHLIKNILINLIKINLQDLFYGADESRPIVSLSFRQLHKVLSFENISNHIVSQE